MKPAYPVIEKLKTVVDKLNDCWRVYIRHAKYAEIGLLAGEFPTRREARDFAYLLRQAWKQLTKVFSGDKPDYSMVIDPKSEE